MIHEGAGHVAAVRPGVADWRQGRTGRTGERSRARGGTEHVYPEGYVKSPSGERGEAWARRILAGVGMEASFVALACMETDPGRDLRVLRGRRRSAESRYRRERAYRDPSGSCQGGSWNGGRPGHHGARGRGMIEREA